MMRLASGLLVAVLLTTCVISGTFAKYISEKSAEDSARVAKWAFEVNGADIAKTDMVFNLFDTIVDTKTDAPETDVKDGGVSEEIIAPGTKGSFVINLENKSEVNATYAIAFSVAYAKDAEDNDMVIPIEYSLTGAADSWKTDINQINVAATNIAMSDGADDGDDEATVG